MAKLQIIAPISGEAVPMSQVPDEIFAEGMAGEGAAIVPAESGEAIAPVSGTLVKLFEGGHAFGISAEGGVELIVHLGLDTVEMHGEGFELLATEGAEVEAGEQIVRFDLDAIRAAGYDPVTPVVVTNSDEHAVGGQASGAVTAGEVLFEVGE